MTLVYTYFRRKFIDVSEKTLTCLVSCCGNVAKKLSLPKMQFNSRCYFAPLVAPITSSKYEFIPLIYKYPLEYPPSRYVRADYTDSVKNFCNQLKNVANRCNKRAEKFIAMAIRNLDGEPEPPLLTAIRIGQSLLVIQLLVEHGLYIGSRDILGNTVLHYAAMHSRKDLFDFFLEQGVDPNEINYEGQTALHIIYNIPDNLEWIRFMLECGLDPDIIKIRLLRCIKCRMLGSIRNDYNRNCENCWHSVPERDKLQLCFDYGADINAVDMWSNTILTIAHEEASVWVKPIIEQIAKIVALGQIVRTEDRWLIKNDRICWTYYIKCCQELVAMKELKFYRDISIFNMLTVSHWQLLSYIRQKDLVEAFEKVIDTPFSIYMDFTRDRFQRTMKKQQLIEATVDVFRKIFSTLPIVEYNHIMENIASYLRERDMMRLLSKY